MPKRILLNSTERKFIAVLGDLTIIFSSLVLLNRFGLDLKFASENGELRFYFFGIFFFFVLAYTLDFYNFDRTKKSRELFNHTVAVVGFFVAVILLGLIFIYDMSFWRKTLFFFFFGTPMVVFLWRYLFNRLFNVHAVKKNVLYIYDKDAEHHVKLSIDKINGTTSNTDYQVKLTLSVNNTSWKDKRIFLEGLDKIDAIVLDLKEYTQLSPEMESLLLRNMVKGVEVLSYTSLYENIYEALPVESHNDCFYEILQLKGKRVRYFKVLFSTFIDVVIGTCVGLFFFVVIPFVWLGNLLGNRGPLFYRQKRVGKLGEEFYVYKFRSMVVDAESSGAQMATRNDARITPFGKWLRKTRIDELPQILSVVKGDMAVIGPRPERKVFTEKLNTILPFYNARHLIKPGITGWAQVKYKYGETLKDSIIKLEYDLYYIKNQSMALDLKIIFKTITTILFSRGQ